MPEIDKVRTYAGELAFLAKSVLDPNYKHVEMEEEKKKEPVKLFEVVKQ